MNYFTARNLVILALVQMALIAATILGAGATYKTYKSMDFLGRSIPWIVHFWCDYGWWTAILPILWFFLCFHEFQKENSTPLR
jgi:hypothetical protein